jgi:hypothetical protein
MSEQALVSVFAGGAAVLAAWLAARFPGVAPRTFDGAFACLVTAMVLASVGPQLVPVVLGAPHGDYLALFVIILPSLTYLMLSLVWMIRLATSVAVRGSR